MVPRRCGSARAKVVTRGKPTRRAPTATMEDPMAKSEGAAVREALSPGTLRVLFDYSPETGELRWRERAPSWFSAATPWLIDRACRSWNARYAGELAFGKVDQKGYFSGAVLGHQVKAHRIIFAIMTGEWPMGEIDHINGRRSDNRWANLRSVSRAENVKNAKLRRDSTTGVPGVNARDGKWRARVGQQGKRRHLGTFSSLSAAIHARKLAEKDAGFHPNHGRTHGSCEMAQKGQ